MDIESLNSAMQEKLKAIAKNEVQKGEGAYKSIADKMKNAMDKVIFKMEVNDDYIITTRSIDEGKETIITKEMKNPEKLKELANGEELYKMHQDTASSKKPRITEFKSTEKKFSGTAIDLDSDGKVDILIPDIEKKENTNTDNGTTLNDYKSLKLIDEDDDGTFDKAVFMYNAGNGKIAVFNTFLNEKTANAE